MGIRNTSTIKLVRGSSAVKVEAPVVETAPTEIFTPGSFASLRAIGPRKSILGKYLSDADMEKAIEKASSEAVAVPREHWRAVEDFFDANDLIRPDFDAYKEQKDMYAEGYRKYGVLYTSETAFDLGDGRQLLFVAQSVETKKDILPEDLTELQRGRPGLSRLTEAYIRIVGKDGNADADFYFNNGLGYPCCDQDNFHLSILPDSKRHFSSDKVKDKDRERCKISQLALAKFLNLIFNKEPIDLSKLQRHEDTEFLLKHF